MGLVYILLPKMVVVLACFAYTRQRSTRDLWLHLLLNVLSVALAPLVRVGVGRRLVILPPFPYATLGDTLILPQP